VPTRHHSDINPARAGAAKTKFLKSRAPAVGIKTARQRRELLIVTSYAPLPQRQSRL
jgi:hypothetical protein